MTLKLTVQLTNSITLLSRHGHSRNFWLAAQAREFGNNLEAHGEVKMWAYAPTSPTSCDKITSWEVYVKWNSSGVMVILLPVNLQLVNANF
jgi:hypothetical protein